MNYLFDKQYENKKTLKNKRIYLFLKVWFLWIRTDCFFDVPTTIKRYILKHHCPNIICPLRIVYLDQQYLWTYKTLFLSRFIFYVMFWFIQFYPLYANYNYKERCELWKSFAIRLICFTIMKILLKAKSSMINSLKIVTCTENCWSALALLLLFKILILIPTYAFFLSVPLSTRVTFCAIRPH